MVKKSKHRSGIQLVKSGSGLLHPHIIEVLLELFLVYDISRRQTFDSIGRWLNELHRLIRWIYCFEQAHIRHDCSYNTLLVTSLISRMPGRYLLLKARRWLKHRVCFYGNNCSRFIQRCRCLSDGCERDLQPY
ncbi:hypothetical protein GBA52_022094 [Prunus armeniaca]|nr:hypothetical protein GBA52_022094 [Prunus armeniaca]